jgi:hypothetical protein
MKKPPGKPPSKAERERKRLQSTAYHEAGHAVIAMHLGKAVRRVSIVPEEEEGNLGHVLHFKNRSFRPDIFDLSDARTRRLAEREILVTLAGRAAEMRHTGRPKSSGDGDDLRYVYDVAWRVCMDDEEAGKYVDWLKVRARNLIANRQIWARVKGLARALIDRPTMTGREAKGVCDAAFDAAFGTAKLRAQLNEAFGKHES